MDNPQYQLKGILRRLNAAAAAYRTYVDSTAVEEIRQVKLDELEGEESKIVAFLAEHGIAVGYTEMGKYGFIHLRPSMALRVTDRPQLEASKAEKSIAEARTTGLRELAVTPLWAIFEMRYGMKPDTWWDISDLDNRLVLEEPAYWQQMVSDPRCPENFEKLYMVIKQMGITGSTFEDIAEWLESIGL